MAGNRMTKKMATVAQRFKEEPFDQALARLIEQEGSVAGAARVLNVRHSTLSNWLLKLGIVMYTLPILPGERVEVKTKDRPPRVSIAVTARGRIREVW